MSETPLANEPGARTETGEIKDVVPKTETTTDPKLELTTGVEPKPDVKAEPKADTKPDDKSLLNKDDKANTGAPEKYEAFKLPDGFTMDEALTKEATELFKGLNVSQDGGQKLVDFYTAKIREAADAPHKAYADMRADWQAKVAADPEIGSKLPEVKATVSRALDSLGDAKLATEFREAMDLTGSGDHPAFIKVFYKLASQIVEGKAVQGGGPSKEGQRAPGAAPQSAAHALYPNLK